MKKIKFGVGALMMLAATLVSDSVAIIGVYLFAALLHELGHILAAKAMKVDIKEIRFGFSGVRIVTDGRLTSYKSEIILALAGPAVNLLIVSLVLLGFFTSGINLEEAILRAESFMSAPAFEIRNVAAFFALSSLMQAALNLLPVKTFDGGRVIYCAIAHFVGERVAERIIELSTMLSCMILWTVALYLMLRVGGGLGIYVFAACIFCLGFEVREYQ